MNVEDRQQLKNLFHAAVDLEAGARAAFLDEACAGRDELRSRVEKLFASHHAAGTFLASPALVDAGVVAAEKHQGQIVEEQEASYDGQRIGPYEIVREIGRGGIGKVYLAVRADDHYRQQVAIKLIKRGMDTAAILRRFMMERQILANLEHPNVARLLDGGTTTDGLPYFVMEHIAGRSINQYCDERRCTTAERLELFRQVCAAVQYAHQNLVVHRDIKPNNILVTAEGVPKLLDFGIAKLLSPSWVTETGDATLSMMWVMTPEYASPEQLRDLPITTASDVYSLGVVLYELLSGRHPYHLTSRRPEEIARLILQKEPLKPSAAITVDMETRPIENHESVLMTPEIVGRTREGSIEKLRRRLSGDLDNIVLKALRREPQRRYASVQEFSEDIRRHLMGLPVAAGPDSFSYRARKFVQRHQAGVAAAAIVVAMLLAATVITNWQARVARRERDKAERRFNESRRIANSLLFEINDSLADLPGATAARELLVKRALEYLNNLSQEAENNPALLKELSVAYRRLGYIQGAPYNSNLGQSSGALQSYQKALEMQENLLQANPNDVEMQKQIGETTYQIADGYYALGNYEEALKHYRRSQSAFEIISASELQESWWKTRLATLYVRSSSMSAIRGSRSTEMNDLKIAQKFSEEALAIAPEDSSVLLGSAQIYSSIGNNLGNPDYNSLGKTDEALELLQKSLSIIKRLAEREPGSTLYQNNLGICLKDIGDIYLAKGDAGKAVESYEKALIVHQAIADKDPKDAHTQGVVGYDLTKLGNSLLASGETEKALKRHERSVAILEKIHLADAESFMVAHTLALSLEGLGDAFKAKKDFIKALASYRRGLLIEEKLDSDSENYELQIKIAQLYFKLGQTRQFISDASRTNESLCRDFRKSVETFTEVQKRTVLSSINLEMFSQARRSAENTNCQKANS